MHSKKNSIDKDLKIKVNKLKFIDICYRDSKDVNCGTNFSVPDTATQPEVNLNFNGGLYTLMLVDLDAASPSDPSLSPFLHWLIINIPGKSISQGEAVKPYLSPTPTPLLGSHAYVFLMFRQPKRISKKTYLDAPRIRFPVSLFAKKNKLIAGNFFYEADPGFYNPQG